MKNLISRRISSQAFLDVKKLRDQSFAIDYVLTGEEDDWGEEHIVHHNQSSYLDLNQATFIGLVSWQTMEKNESYHEELSEVLPKLKEDSDLLIKILLRNAFCELNFQEFKWGIKSNMVETIRIVSKIEIGVIAKGNIGSLKQAHWHAS